MTPLVLVFFLAFSSVFAAKDRTQLQLLLDINEEKWEGQKAVAYHMDISVQCFCPVDARGPFKVSVKNEAIVSVDPDNKFGKKLPTVSGLFKIIQKAIDAKAEVIRVKYHPLLGYPTSIFIDKSRLLADEEIGYTVSVTNIVKGTPINPKPVPIPGDNGFSPKLHRFQFNRWVKGGLTSYKFKFERVCFCNKDFVGPFIITVKNNRVVKAVFAKNPIKPIPYAIRKKLPTLPGLFRIITNEAAKAAKVKVKYDARYGYPSEAKIDRIKGAIDDEITYKAKLLHH